MLWNRTILREKIHESLTSVLPVTVIVLLLCFTVTPVSGGMLMTFLCGAVMVIVGMGLFTLGAETAMTPMGEYVGAQMTKSRKLGSIVCISLFVGIMITISEPDLQVLAGQVPTVPNMTLVLSVATGVGVFLVISMLRILFHIELRYLLWLFYIIVFTLAVFVDPSFRSVAYDSGGVTTGPMTVPFIMALGVGVSSIRSDKEAQGDSFGLVALCSIGPILAVLILGLLYNTEDASYIAESYPLPGDSREMFWLFCKNLPHYMKEVLAATGPIVLFFFVYHLFHTKLNRDSLVRITVGVAYTYVGLVLFLTGANVGFMPAGQYIGTVIGASDWKWIVIPIGMVIGYFIVAAEPAVHVLKKQVEEITAGAIPQKALAITLGLGIACAAGIGLLRALTGINIFYFLVPGYLLALMLTFFVPPIFTSIAFDSGGVASGTMTATFLLPFTMGVCEASGGNVVTDAFGIVAMVAMMPLIAIQLLGMVYKLRLAKAEKDAVTEPLYTDDDIIDL
ncbi:MAG: DUF1538 domain-containing protein [Ruminococcaceae bacterium]|nr:DUF1538 domain-containing protein [Oscillospiraceae bacterium]